LPSPDRPGIVARMSQRQVVRGDFAVVDGLADEVERARRAAGLSWPKLAAGSPWSRQYLQRVLRAGELPAAVVEYLQQRLGLSLSLTPTSPLIAHAPGAP
jgi:ribosome-binding protein aMBF1 (putative translation factor)